MDNTIICYDRAFSRAAMGRGVLPATAGIHRKEEIRAYLRAQGKEGLGAWQALQGYVYGRAIDEAELFEGVPECLAALASAGHELYIISHKTEYGHFDETRTNLRDAASSFLRRRGVMKYIPRERIRFCATLEEKIATIAALRCHAFVDDLTDVLLHPGFPSETSRVLFRATEAGSGYDTVASWSEIFALVTRPTVT